jgi:anionic cell wall polymer biosynthesis LytR-Cps2A-Psr (LCP) family protein
MLLFILALIHSNNLEDTSNRDYKRVSSAMRLFARMFAKSSNMTTLSTLTSLSSVLQENIKHVFNFADMAN